MHIKKAVTGSGAAIVLAALLLTGCSSPAAEETAAPETSATAEADAGATDDKSSDDAATDCPELAEGATVAGSALISCIGDTMSGSQGFSVKTSGMGLDSTGRYDSATRNFESLSALGSLVVVDGKGYVRSGADGAWQEADASSSDPVIAALSTQAELITSMGPDETLSTLYSMPPGLGDFTVSGTGERLGEKVFLLSGTLEAEGANMDVTYEVTADFAMLASAVSTEASGQKVEMSSETIEWDAAQDISAPM